MSLVRVHNFSISLDGFGTGDGPTLDAPFGHAGGRLHEWYFPTRFVRSMVFGEAGGSVGPWTGLGTDEEWRGWWGPNPPFHTPVFVLTHHPRPPLTMEGGTTFYFVDASPQEALALARQAAGDRDVRIGGGPATIRDFLAADLIDVLHVAQVPILLGRGVRLWDGLEGLEKRFAVEVVASPSGVTHLTFTRR
jgi:dihydrofolate reductase